MSDSADSVNEKSPEVKVVKSSKDHVVIKSRDADVTLHFMEAHDKEVEEITPEEEKKLARKTTIIILILTAMTDLLLYADKATLSYASIFELWADTNMTQNRYNNANTLFYAGFLIGQLNLFFVQKFPIGKFLTLITFLWTVIIFLTCTATSYQGIYALRFFLGFVESVVVPILNATMGQFMTSIEKAATAPVFYSTCIGVTIPVGFIAYGVLHAHIAIPIWKLFMIIIASCTFVWTIVIFFYYPNNPTDAKFLSTKEKVWVIRRVQGTTGASVEQKVFKRYQAIEAFKDPISWLFGLFFLLQQLANNLAYQQNLLFEGIGNISNLDSTLVSVASGGWGVICCFIATYVLYWKKDITAFSVVFWTLPSFASSIAIATMPWDQKIGLLANLCIASQFGIPWILMFSWTSTTCSGYTKKLIRNGIIMAGYSIANLISPQLWQEKDGPRYVPAWIVQIVLSFFLAPLVALVIWYILRKRNIVRLAALSENSDSASGYVEEDDGVEVKVNKAALDLTDLENEEFIYPL
ncbi:DEKNAAC103045 [Brettanomyces naardenensis]|uniref:DEKNAAC103045 n=1 Tax=Brettanomyces naardenensis TaxID=13370 RepID=A0A448YM88_BRENA|nr:DEKNAAC103045 [Brettanomyces naardenensis]